VTAGTRHFPQYGIALARYSSAGARKWRRIFTPSPGSPHLFNLVAGRDETVVGTATWQGSADLGGGPLELGVTSASDVMALFSLDNSGATRWVRPRSTVGILSAVGDGTFIVLTPQSVSTDCAGQAIVAPPNLAASPSSATTARTSRA